MLSLTVSNASTKVLKDVQTNNFAAIKGQFPMIFPMIKQRIWCIIHRMEHLVNWLKIEKRRVHSLWFILKHRSFVFEIVNCDVTK